MKKIILLVFTACIIQTNSAQIWNAPAGIREIPISNLPDVAIATLDAWGPVIYYNPSICQQAGPLATAFFEAHEYGHHYLGHVIQNMINRNNPYTQFWLNLTAENAADAYACRYWVTMQRKDVIQAWVQLMHNTNNPGDQTHAPSRVRAQNVANLFYQLTGFPLFP